jgi:hypothetical protein
MMAQYWLTAKSQNGRFWRWQIELPGQNVGIVRFGTEKLDVRQLGHLSTLKSEVL